MKKFVTLIFIVMATVLAAPQLIAEPPPPIPAQTKPVSKEVDRIAPPLAILLKQFKQDPNSEAEVISRKTHVTIDENYFSHAVSYVAVYINSDEAVRDYSQISISFNSFYEDITLEFANVRTPEGSVDSIKPDATQVQNPSDENFYQDRKELLFSLPNVRKGSTIEFQYRYTDTKKIIPSQWFDSFSMNWWEGRAANQGSRSDAVANTELTITAPKQLLLFSNDLSSMGIVKSQHEKNNQQTLTWKGTKLPKVILQDNMPRNEQRNMQLRVSTMESWQQIAAWANQLSLPHAETDKNLEKTIDGIRQKALTPEAKVKAVYQTLQEKIRYVFAHVGRGGYEPHDAFEVLTNGYGDCKDQTILAVTLLRKLGINADPALVITRSRGIPDMSITSVSFDHMIVHIPAQQGLNEIWMDTSGDKSLFPGFSIGLEGQPALIVNELTKNIVTIPTRGHDKHVAHFDIAFNKFAGRDTEADFTLTLSGDFEQRLRSLWQFSRERDKTFREFLGHLYSTAEVTRIKANNADDLWQAFTVDGHYLFNNVWSGPKEPLTYGFNISQLINLFTDFRDIHKPADRIQDYEIDPGYTISAHLVFGRPTANHKATLISQGQNLDNAFFSLKQNGREENGNYVIDATLTIKPNRISPQEYPRFYEQIHQLLDTKEWTLVFNYDKDAAEIAKLTEAIAETDEAANLIALAKLHIKNGDYEKALAFAKQAILDEPKNAEAFYILGLAQGYNNLLYESEKSFAKAEALGFNL